MHSFQATFRVQSAETNWPRLKAINKQVTLTASFNQLSRTAFFIYRKISKAMHLSEEMDWDFFCYHAASFPVLNSCQFNAKHFQLGFKRSVEIHWLPKWIVNGIGYWKRAVLLLPLAISHNFKIGLLVNGILRCQCFLAGLGFVFFFIFSVLLSLFTQKLCCVDPHWLLYCFIRSWIRRQEQAQPIAWAQPGAMWGWCHAEPRLIDFDFCRSLLAWPGGSDDFYCFFGQQRLWTGQVVLKPGKQKQYSKPLNTARNLLFPVGFNVRTILPLRMFWGGAYPSQLEAVIQNMLALVVHLDSIICPLMQLQVFKPHCVGLHFGSKVIQGHQPWETLPNGLAQVYLLIFLPQVLLKSPFAVLNKFSSSLMHLLFRDFHVVVLFLAIVLARNNSQGAAGHLHATAVLEIIAPSMLTPFQIRLGNSQSKSWLLLVQKWAGLPSLPSTINYFVSAT